ncbi:MAG: YIP1 family protein [Candidatus Aenigmatarchaeota archaeon]
MIVNYLKNPSKAFEEVKESDLKETIGIQALVSVIFTINTFIGLDMLKKMDLVIKGPEAITTILSFEAANLGIAAFFIVFIGGLFFGWIMKIIMNMLGGDGDYFEGLVTVAYPLLLGAIGILVAMVVSYIPTVGIGLTFLTIAAFIAAAYASLFRFASEMFEVKMITAFIGVTILFAVIMVSIYGSLATTASGLTSILPA